MLTWNTSRMQSNALCRQIARAHLWAACENYCGVTLGTPTTSLRLVRLQKQARAGHHPGDACADGDSSAHAAHCSWHSSHLARPSALPPMAIGIERTTIPITEISHDAGSGSRVRPGCNPQGRPPRY